MACIVGTKVRTTHEITLKDDTVIPEGSEGVVVKWKEKLKVCVVDFESPEISGVWLKLGDIEKV